MSILKKLSSSNFDVDKPVIVCGKGPSIGELGLFGNTHDLRDYYLCGINTAYQLMPYVDFLSFCDLTVLRSLDENVDQYSKIKDFICPLVLRDRFPDGGVRDTNETFQFLLDKTKDMDVGVYTYTLFTQTKQVEVDTSVQDNFYMSQLLSSYHCALNWLTRAGFRKFEVFGVSKRNEYHQTYVENNDAGVLPDSFYNDNFNQGVEIMDKVNSRYTFH